MEVLAFLTGFYWLWQQWWAEDIRKAGVFESSSWTCWYVSTTRIEQNPSFSSCLGLDLISFVCYLFSYLSGT